MGVSLWTAREELKNAFILCRAFSRDFTAAILVLQDKEMATILMYQTSPLGGELYFYAKIVFCFDRAIWKLVCEMSENALFKVSTCRI